MSIYGEGVSEKGKSNCHSWHWTPESTVFSVRSFKSPHIFKRVCAPIYSQQQNLPRKDKGVTEYCQVKTIAKTYLPKAQKRMGCFDVEGWKTLLVQVRYLCEWSCVWRFFLSVLKKNMFLCAFCVLCVRFEIRLWQQKTMKFRSVFSVALLVEPLSTDRPLGHWTMFVSAPSP